jgi:IS30 family transposase
MPLKAFLPFVSKNCTYQLNSAITHQQVKEVEQKLNNRPVRKFNYQTPNQVLQGKIALIT